ncbi:MAG: DnaJ domain-containing protein [Gammaproteobacteria bacterium]|nr:DnaJ domain-containing protein [Gammaproteobacteria bacterium]
MIRLILALLAVVGIWFFINWIARQPPATRSKLLRQIFLFGGIALVVLAVLTGRLHWLFALIVGLIPLLQRVLMLTGVLKSLKSAMGPKEGQKSEVSTRFLHMELDHDTGAMNGEVLAGKFQGRLLDDLSFEELVELLGECRGVDAQSVAVLEAYLVRVHGDRWRQQYEQSGQVAGDGTMTHEEAYQILGLAPDASRKQIVEAHRKLMQKLHPDRGGPTYLAAKINQAKDLLLSG